MVLFNLHPRLSPQVFPPDIGCTVLQKAVLAPSLHALLFLLCIKVPFVFRRGETRVSVYPVSLRHLWFTEPATMAPSPPVVRLLVSTNLLYSTAYLGLN